MPGIRIVIIEDEIMVRDMIGDLVSRIPGMLVVGVAGAIEEGFASCTDLRPNLAIVDWILPDGTALELVRKLRASIPGIAVLLLTTNEQSVIVKDAAALGVQGFVSRKQPASVLRDAILALAAGKHYYCPTSYRTLIEALREPKSSPVDKLSSRDWSLLRALSSGLGTREIAGQMKLSPKTVSNQLCLLKEKLGIAETSGLVLYALRHGLVDPGDSRG